MRSVFLFISLVRILIECVDPHNILWFSLARWLMAAILVGKYCRKWIFFYLDLFPVLLPGRGRIIFHQSRQEIISGMKYLTRHQILSKDKQFRSMLISTFFHHVFPLEFEKSSHAKFSTQVVSPDHLFRILLPPELTGPSSIYQNPGFSSYFLQAQQAVDWVNI